MLKVVETPITSAIDAATKDLHGVLDACAAMRGVAGNEISGNGPIEGTTVLWFAEQIGAAVQRALEQLEHVPRAARKGSLPDGEDIERPASGEKVGGQMISDAMFDSFQIRLKAWREHRDLTQEGVAAALGVAHTSIGRWEKGEMALSVPDLKRLAAVYRCTPNQLMEPPSSAEFVARLDEIKRLLSAMPAEVRSEWLAVGRRPRRDIASGNGLGLWLNPDDRGRFVWGR